MLTRARRRHGVTLIELAVALALVGLLLFVATPSLTSAMANARIRGAAESMQAGLQKARMEAMRRNQAITFSIVSSNADGGLDNDCALSSTGTSWVVSQDAPAGKCAVSVSTTTDPRIVDKRAGEKAAQAVGVQGIATGTTTANSVTFDSLGRISSGTLRRINFTSATGAADARALRIEMTAGGVLRVCEPAVTATDDPRICLH